MTGTRGLQDLFCIADKYEVCRLKEICAEAMCKNLSSSNVVSTLLLADKHALREAGIKFIASHASQVMATQEWKDIYLKVHVCRLFQDGDRYLCQADSTGF